MTSVREAIFAEVERRLRELLNIGEVERVPSGDPRRFPALEIAEGGPQVRAEQEYGSTRWRMTIVVAGYVEGGSGARAHAAINDLHARACQVLFTEPPLGGLVEMIEEGDVRFQVATLASEGRMAFAQDVIVQFATQRGNPALPA